MSDFDEEAERERLREKYEREQQDREATERMSELLLQGATMTNAHCSDCGDPVFRYEGQEFCATCEKAVDRDDGDEPADQGDEGSGAEADADPDPVPGEGEHIEVTSPDDTAVRFGDGAGEAAADPEPTPEAGAEADASDAAVGDPAGETGAESPSREASDPAPSRRVPGVDPAGAAAPPTRDRGGQTGAGWAEDPTPDRDGGLADARATLERTVAREARRAEAAADPTTAREHLAAAREAAEALAALRR